MAGQLEVPLNHPHYGLSFTAAVRRGFLKYATFTGRAGRAEYWWWGLFVTLIVLVPPIPGVMLKDQDGPLYWAGGLLSLAGLVASIVPSFSLTWRRLHDTGRSGAFYLVNFIPLVGGLILIIFLLDSTRPSAERFGPPYGSGPVSAAAYGAGTGRYPGGAATAKVGPASAKRRRRPLLVGVGVSIALLVLILGATRLIFGVSTPTAKSAPGWQDSGGQSAGDSSDQDGGVSGYGATPGAVPPVETYSTDPTTESTQETSTQPVVVDYADGDACESAGTVSDDGYPVAICRFWKTPKGHIGGMRMAKGYRQVLCQNDLGVRNPRYTTSQSNTWWLWAAAADGALDWYPETAIVEGTSDQPVNGVALC